MKKSIYPCLWFDGKAQAAAEFYCSIFDNSKIIIDKSFFVHFEIEGKLIMAMNGGPMYKINPSISLFVTCSTIEEVDSVWNQLSNDGNIMMILDEYPWSKKYGFVTDKFGVSWQIMLGEIPPNGQKIMPCLLFVGQQFGKAQDSIQHYISTFPNSKMLDISIDDSEDPKLTGSLKFGNFTLQNDIYAAMDGYGEHHFQFNDGFSFVVECDTQEEIDTYWARLTEGGSENKCGWLKDRFGVSWQIIPSVLIELMSDPKRAQRVAQAFMNMKKMDIETIVKA